MQHLLYKKEQEGKAIANTTEPPSSQHHARAVDAPQMPHHGIKIEVLVPNWEPWCQYLLVLVLALAHQVLFSDVNVFARTFTAISVHVEALPWVITIRDVNPRNMLRTYLGPIALTTGHFSPP